MHALIVCAHPRPASFTQVVAAAVAAGVAAAGHDSELADLYREGFDPRFGEADFAQFHGGVVPADVAREQARVDRADGLVFVFPVWWWSFPAILKGWIDRVFSEGWAYRFDPALSRGILADRPTLLLGIGASRQSTAERYGYAQAMRTQLLTGVLGYCGLRNVEAHVLYDVDGSAPERARFIELAHQCSRELFAPARLQRSAQAPCERPA